MDQLKTYIQDSRSKGASDEEIRESLVKAGWQESMVNEALQGKTNPLMPPPPPPGSSAPVNTSKPKSMWDTFEHILMFISMYVLATSIALTIHLFIDRWLPPVTQNSSYFTESSYYNSFQDTLLKGYLASLIVSFPLFSFFFLDITKRTREVPSLRNLSSRKTLIYFTLVMTFIFMIYSVIHIIFNMLNGNVSINFFLHFINTVTVAGIIFAYYFLQVKEDSKLHG